MNKTVALTPLQVSALAFLPALHPVDPAQTAVMAGVQVMAVASVDGLENKVALSLEVVGLEGDNLVCSSVEETDYEVRFAFQADAARFEGTVMVPLSAILSVRAPIDRELLAAYVPVQLKARHPSITAEDIQALAKVAEKIGSTYSDGADSDPVGAILDEARHSMLGDGVFTLTVDQVDRDFVFDTTLGQLFEPEDEAELHFAGMDGSSNDAENLLIVTTNRMALLLRFSCGEYCDEGSDATANVLAIFGDSAKREEMVAGWISDQVVATANHMHTSLRAFSPADRVRVLDALAALAADRQESQEAASVGEPEVAGGE